MKTNHGERVVPHDGKILLKLLYISSVVNCNTIIAFYNFLKKIFLSHSKNNIFVYRLSLDEILFPIGYGTKK